MQPIPLDPIGYVRSPFPTPGAVPAGGGPGELVIDPRLVDGLSGVERCSHLVILAWLHHANRLILRPIRRRGGWVDADGVFACRYPARPNPISFTVAPLLRRVGNELHVDHLDLCDGTPILDLKPYVPGWDAVFAARRAPVRAGPSGSRVDLLERALEQHLGEEARAPAAQLALAAVRAAAAALGADPRHPGLRVTLNRADAALDAVQGLLGATFASGRVRATAEEGPAWFRFELEGRVLELREVAGGGAGPALTVLRTGDARVA